jgi:hypothetical protein
MCGLGPTCEWAEHGAKVDLSMIHNKLSKNHPYNTFFDTFLKELYCTINFWESIMKWPNICDQTKWPNIFNHIYTHFLKINKLEIHTTKHLKVKTLLHGHCIACESCILLIYIYGTILFC